MIMPAKAIILRLCPYLGSVASPRAMLIAVPIRPTVEIKPPQKKGLGSSLRISM